MYVYINVMYPRLLLVVLLALFSTAAFAATNFISDQLPAGKTLADYGLGARPEGGPERAVRLVELAVLRNTEQVQQIVSHGDKLYLATLQGRIWEYDLVDGLAARPFFDLTGLGSNIFYNAGESAPSCGLRGFAIHPEVENNCLVYTMQKVLSDGSTTHDYGSDDLYAEYLCVEWDLNAIVDGMPTMRQLFRVRFEHDYHVTHHLLFNPTAEPGSSDYGMLYVGFGDNGIRTGGVISESQIREVNDVSNVTQDFNSVQGGVIRIDPLDPSGKTDEELASAGLKRSPNGNFSIPLDNPFVGMADHKEELFAKGFRNPLTFSFSPRGALVVGEVGEQSMEEINVIVSGGNYGWPNREGTFLVAWADQIDGSPLGSDESMRWMPSGEVDDPAVSYYVRDKNQENLRQEMLARSGAYDDGFEYPVFQFSHEGNASNETEGGLAAVVGGDFYTGFWAEELEGLYLFANLSTDQIFFGAASDLDVGVENAEVQELPLIDVNGDPVALSTIIGSNRANLRFGKDSYGNLYFASKTNNTLYRLQGTPELDLTVLGVVAVAELGDGQYFELGLERPPADDSLTYVLEVSEDPVAGFSPAKEEDYKIVSTVRLSNGKELVTYRYLEPVDAGAPRFFRFSW